MTPGQRGSKYDLNEMYRNAFGHIRPPYPTVVAESRTVGLNPVGTVRALRGLFRFASGLGADYTMPTSLNGWQLPNEPIIRINASKDIKETKLTRLDSNGFINRQNVLEEINQNNYRIRLRGLLINEEDPDDYPEEQLRKLREIVLSAGSVTINNALTDMWGISRIAIEDFDLEELRGNISVQSYSIVGYSDSFVDLEMVDSPERL